MISYIKNYPQPRFDFVEFLMIAQAHVVSFQFSMNLNHKQCNNTIVAVTKIPRRITMHKNTRSYLGKTLLNQGKNPTILCYRVKRRSPFYHKP
jgi:hypothetical protein